MEIEFGSVGETFTIQLDTSKRAKLIKTLREAYYELTAGSPCDINLYVPEELILDLECDIEIPQSAQRFKILYFALCSFYSITPSSDAVHYIETLFKEENIEVNLQECPGMEAESSFFDVRPFIQCLGMNTYFRSVIVNDIQDPSVIPELCAMLQKNTSLTRLQISNVTKNTNKLDRLGNAFESTTRNSIIDIIISNTNLSKAIEALTSAISVFTHGLRILRLSDCSLKAKKLHALIHDGLMKNYPMALALKEIDLSGNRFDENSSEIFQRFLARIGPHSPLQRLILRDCNISWIHIARSIHLFEHLYELDLSNNALSEADIQLLCTTIERVPSLQKLGLAGCGIKQNSLEALSHSLSASTEISALHYNLANNSMSANCIQALFGPLQRSWMLQTLDLSGCKINDSVCLTLCSAIQATRECKLEKLILDDAKLDSILLSQRTAHLVAESLCKTLQSKDCIKSLSLSGGFSVNILLPLFDMLKNIESLQELNISNNKLGDSGASALASLIRDNRSLTSIICDGNNFSLPGFYAIGLSVKLSETLLHFAIPWNDLTQNIAASKGKFKLPATLMMDIYLRLNANKEKNVYSPFSGEVIEKNPVSLLPIPPVLVPQVLVDQLDDWEMEALNLVASKVPVVTSIPVQGIDLSKQPDVAEDESKDEPPSYPSVSIEESSNSEDASLENEPPAYLEKRYSGYVEGEDDDTN
eukprot:CAMPEP_0206189116 /NCGR_PEP_ID=MMETSP0166-20121206/3987_1 /ASSEMBLY_ACC=CAM_ASM_000260 /TAXON_ID=95228 /ORGANISM="Vannella robusta, Strain DIVA3 518/3/11/1/6" /LENGTH=703 /DNA_ID=CAMNT_0053604991 /DNA_START=429 /DNA_END=2540 /DNA_ORIENTATION=+